MTRNILWPTAGSGTNPVNRPPSNGRGNKRRPWLLAVPAAAWLAAAPAEAAVEFVTPVNSCEIVDRIGDNKDLRVSQGTLRFMVWGSGVDSAQLNQRLTVNGGTDVTATIVGKKSGPENAFGDCRYATGSVIVEVRSPNQQADLRRTLMFPMPFGSASALAVTFRAQRPFDWTWANLVLPQCLMGSSGSNIVDLNSSRHTINLPAGARNDTSNCAAELRSAIRIDSAPAIDIDRPFDYRISGQPAWLSPVAQSRRANGLAVTGRDGHPLPRFNVDVLQLRQISRSATFTLTATNDNGRSSALTLVVNPGPANGIESVVCGNSNRIPAGQNFLCEMRFAASVPQGQLITYQAPSFECFLDSSGRPLDGSGIGQFRAPAAGQLQRVPLTHVPGINCGGQLGSTVGSLRLNFWRGGIGEQSGPDFATLTVTPQ